MLERFYHRRCEPELKQRLPLSWDTTSDSLSALLANLLEADELVLLKSSGAEEQTLSQPIPARQRELQSLADQGVIDRAMVAIGLSIPTIRLVNLRL